MEREQMIELTKRKISSRSGYGMFDWLDRLMEREALLSLRPRMLISHAALILDMPAGDIPYGAFRAWLGRYRKTNNAPCAKKRAGTTDMTATENKGEDEITDWRDFKPTELVVPTYRDEGPILKRIDYSKLDG